MAKAHLTLPNGTQVVIEGTPDEVHRLMSLNTAEPQATTPRTAGQRGTARRKARAAPKVQPARDASTSVELSNIVNLVKNCDEADQIETNILDRSSRVDRILLPLYILQKFGAHDPGLTSGEIAKVTRELGVPVSQSNASTALSSAASKYVMGDKVRRKGETVRYRLSRRGAQYIEQVIGGKSSAG